MEHIMKEQEQGKDAMAFSLKSSHSATGMLSLVKLWGRRCTWRHVYKSLGSSHS
jgi:hypothetical protein